MKVYLVGGAVRDMLLGQPVQERDWVVVGATPHELLALGFQQVGQHFPVFLHPQTHEEYALARTEVKSGHGYQGFTCHFSPDVSLEEDLLRRDLTINAIAMDKDGQIIDPYHGQADLKDGLLKHVSPAFIEDPLRVLRAARFHAKFAHLGFKIAPETMTFMRSMVASGELNHLSSERIWKEWSKAFNTTHPEVFIQSLDDIHALKLIAPELNVQALKPWYKRSNLSQRPEIGMILCWYYGVTASDLKSKIDKFKILAQGLNIPKKLSELSMKYFKLSQILKTEQLSAPIILNIFESLDAFRQATEFHDCLECAKTDQLLTEKQQIQLELILKNCSKLKLEPSLKHTKDVSKIKDFFRTKRLEMIQSLINS
jgi:tRNA nucleotidyltransferase/poly(A) polymerase